MSKSPIILTRYLYVESSVCHSLVSSLLSKDRDEALFWAFELYWSGFQKKVYDLIFQTLKIRFPTYENLYNCLFEKYWNEGVVPDNVVLFVENLCAISEDDENQFKQNLLVEAATKENIKQNETNHEIKMNFHYLPKVCKFQIKEETDPKIMKKRLDIFRNNWLSHAAYSPIWKERIVKFGGVIDKRKKSVTFPNDDMFDDFHDEYGVEPEEQPKTIYRACLGVTL